MIRFIPVTFVVFGFSCSLFAGDGPSAVRRDTEFPVEVHTTLHSGSVKVGETVEFRTAEAVLIGNNVVVPENSVILGTVTEVRNRENNTPRRLIRIRFHTLRWKSGETGLNAMVVSVRHARVMSPDWGFRHTPTFMEGVRIVSHLRPEAFTDFFSDEKNFTIHSGVSLTLRQVDPNALPDRDFNILSDYQRSARNFVH